MSIEEVTTYLPDGGPLVAPSETQLIATGREMNNRAIPPIHKLPAEILANIMRIVVSCAPCIRQGGTWLTNDPVLCYPDVLSHVCSRWWQVAVHSRDLWSHIDITDWNTSGSRAMTLLDRAGQLPLRLHFIDHFGTCRRSNNPVDRISFLAPVTPQLESPELVPSTDGLSRARTSALSIFLAACTARNLTELALRIIYGGQISTPIFIKPRNHAIETATMTDGMRAHIDIPEERLEAMLRGLTVLKLSQVYPQWTSSAYCGLVELRLLAGALFNAKIPESQLMGILRSSPRLRILQFGLTIVDTVPLDTAVIDPIVLRDLEVLSLDWTQGFRAEIFLRWLAPAPKLFQFSLCRSRYYANDIYSVHPITVAFLAKSNITMIYTNLLAQEIVDLVSHCLHAKILACDNLLDYDEETMPFQLNTLYLIECELEMDSLRRLIRSSSSQRLIIYRSDFLYNCRLLSPDQIPAMLSDICSDVFVLPKDDPSSIAEWEVSWP